MTLKFVCQFILLIAAASGVGAQTPSKQTRRLTLNESVTAEIKNFRGSVYIYAKNLDTGQEYDWRGGEQVRTASTIKLPIMIAVFADVADKKRQWSDEFVLSKDKKIAGSGVLNEFSDGTRIDLKTAVNLMIVVSDNTATNLILDAVTTDAVNARMAQLGLTKTHSLRKIGGGGDSQIALEPINKNFGIGQSTPREMAKLLEMLERGEIISKEASAEMIAILRRQQDTSGITRNVLDTVPTISKSGALDRLRSDVGIIYGRRGRIVMAITIDDMLEVNYSEDNAGKLLLWRLSKILQEGLAK